MADFRADLHCHTTCSDGSMTPLEVVDLAVSIGLSGLSITDHDSVEAYITALPYAKEKGLEMVSGAEFSSTHKYESVHILAYAFNRSSPAIRSLCERHSLRRKHRNLAILEKLAKHGMPISEDEINLITSTSDIQKGKRTPGRPHIALAMIKKGYIETVAEAFQKYIGEGKSCYAAGDSISAEETIAIIHEAKGLAIIAHPHLILEPSLIRRLVEMDFDGLEGYYAKFSADQEKKWIELARKKNWLITGGSDFHGSIKPNIPLGCSWVDQSTFNTLKELDRENNR